MVVLHYLAALGALGADQFKQLLVTACLMAHVDGARIDAVLLVAHRTLLLDLHGGKTRP